MIRYEYTPEELLSIGREAIAKTKARLDALASGDLIGFEGILADMSETLDPLMFLKDVHTESGVRDAANTLTEERDAFANSINARRDLYDVVRASTAGDPLTARLREQYLIGFRQNGLDRDDAIVAKVHALNDELSAIETAFHKNLVDNKDRIRIGSDEVAGLPASFLARLEREDGAYLAGMRDADSITVMKHAIAPVRRRMLETYERREEASNTPLFERAIAIRQEIATTLDRPDWATYTLEDQMAKTPTRVLAFIDDLVRRMRPILQQELQELIARKRQESDEPFGQHDILYYRELLRNEQCGIDSEALRDYFPAGHVLDGMFSLYSALLGVTFQPVDAPGWHESVRWYAVKDGEKTVAHFATDLFARDDKYSHFAAFNLRDPRTKDGKAVTPLSAIVGNFSPGADGESYLTHDEVVTLFHEFGHIMHYSLCKTPYASLNSFHTTTDFVEAPSQMLENWAWDKEVLRTITKHRKTGEPLDDATAEKLIASRDHGAGFYWTRQLLFGTFDMRVHTAPTEGLMVNPLWRELYTSMIGIPAYDKSAFPAGFGHLMGGYDAGYYGYAWSKAFAQDMYSRFDGPFDTATGMEYRRLILEPGYTREPDAMLRDFLGREPSSEAFAKLFEKNG